MHRVPVTTVILAGGQGSRIGGDKGLKALRGRPLIEWVIGSLRAQDTDIVISANANEAAYAAFGYPVVADAMPGYAGPLAGVHAAMQRAARQEAGAWLASVPCDTPFLPHDLIARLLAAADGADAAVAVAEGRRHSTIAVYRVGVLARLGDYLARGDRRVGDWLRLLHAREAVFEHGKGFFNINSLQELEAANRVHP